MAPPAALRLMAISALLLLCAPTTSASQTPRELVDSIKMATTKGQALQAPAQSITILNGPLILIGQGPFPQIITGFTDIVTHLTNSIAAIKGTEAISGSDAQYVADAVRELVRVHQVLLNILTGKAGLFQTVPFIGQPIAAVLRAYEGVIDAYMFEIIGLVSSDAEKSITEQANSLDVSINNAVNAYQGLGLVRFWR